ncbi:MAG: large repetitive protein, partial [Thermoanaerobaculia bacterium]|nr:large repetitive protein [Thermoanaerobaculia bacterium]
SVAGPVVVTATVNNVQKSITVTFQDPVIPPIPTPTTPTITAVTPNFGLPTGNQSVVISGTNFRAPVRVLFDPGNGQAAKEGFATSVTPTAITVTTPAFDLGVSQQLVVGITVITEAGTPTEQRATKAAAFTYTAPVLTPFFRGASPTSGPIDGGTRITIVGDAFEAPLQVFFGSAQAQVIGSVTFHQFDVLSPTARETNPNGSGTGVGPVDIKIVNLNSGKSVVAPAAFRYIDKSQITAITPNQGPFTGGTRVVIDGSGFNAPVTVSFNGIAANVISVFPTQITAITNPIAVTGCSDSTGATVVTNVDNGDQATGPSFIYRVLKPAISSVTGANPTPGSTVSVTVVNAVGLPRILIGGAVAPILGQTTNPDGTTTFSVQVPSTLKFDQQACSTAGANAAQQTAFDVTYTSLTTSCTDTLTKGLTLVPPAGPIFTLIGAIAPFVGVIDPGPPVTVGVTPDSQIITVVDTGNTTPLTITGITQTPVGGTGCSRFAVLSSQLPPTNLNQCEALPLTIKYNAPTAPTPVADQCTITIQTNAGNKSFTLNGTTR